MIIQANIDGRERAVFHNKRIAVYEHPDNGWLIASQAGWWSVEEIDQETLEFLRAFTHDRQLPLGFRKNVLAMLERADAERRRHQYPNLVILHGVNLQRML